MKTQIYSGKVILLIILLMFFALTGFAQTQIGLRLGANASRVTGNTVHEVQKTGVGFNAGFFYRINLGGLLLQPEMVVSGRNFAFSQDVDTTGLGVSITERKVKSTYLDFPVLLIVELTKNTNVLVGPQFSVRMSDRQTVAGDPVGNAYQQKWYDIGVTGGVNYVFPSGIDLTLRGLYGITPIFEKNNLNIGGIKSPDIRSLQLQFTVGLPISSNTTEEPDRSSYKTIY